MKYILVILSIVIFISACSSKNNTTESLNINISNEQADTSQIPPICDPEDREMQCLTKKAIWYKDLSYCEKFTSFDYYGVNDCYSDSVYEIKDPSICSNIESDRKNKLITEELRTSCYMKTAHATGDIAVCDFIQDIKIKNECKDQTEIDFSLCKADRKTIFVAFGSTTYEIIGKEGDKCIMNYGGEVENPNWDGKLTIKCQVPVSVGRQIFFKTNYGVDFSPIKDYCTS